MTRPVGIAKPGLRRRDSTSWYGEEPKTMATKPTPEARSNARPLSASDDGAKPRMRRRDSTSWYGEEPKTMATKPTPKMEAA